MPTPDFVLDLRRSVGQAELWLPAMREVFLERIAAATSGEQRARFRT